MNSLHRLVANVPTHAVPVRNTPVLYTRTIPASSVSDVRKIFSRDTCVSCSCSDSISNQR